MGKNLRTMLCSLLILFSVTGCEKNIDVPDEPTGTLQISGEEATGEEKNVDEANGIPDEVMQKLRSVSEQESAPVPENGWTDAEILDVIYVNGEKLTIPFTLKDLGEGFEILEDSLLTKDSGTTVSLTYYGESCGVCGTAAQATLEDFADQPLNMLSFNNLFNKEGIKALPISVNGVTFKTSYDDMVSRLGFTAEDDADDSDNSKSFVVTGYTESYYIKISGSDAEVHGITFAKQQK